LLNTVEYGEKWVGLGTVDHTLGVVLVESQKVKYILRPGGLKGNNRNTDSNWILSEALSPRITLYDGHDAYTHIYGHRTLKAPHPVRSAQLSRVPLS
jgi:hypothetical protein